MSDSELLRLAAKAAEIKYVARTQSQGMLLTDHATEWNPLQDDGDALRLAVKLDMHIRFFRKHVDVDPKPFALGTAPISEDFTQHKEEATRRAIVRAAAEIGRAML